MKLDISSILGFAKPFIGMAVPHGAEEITAIEALAANPLIQTADDLVVATEAVVLNYLPEDKLIFDAIIETARGVEHLIAAIEAKSAPKV